MMKMNVSRKFGGFRRIFVILLATCLGLAFLGCRNPASSSGPTVDSVAVIPSDATVKRGETKVFIAVVNGSGSPAQTITWAVGGGDAGTSITPTGILTVAANEPADTLTVQATSTVDSSKAGTATVTVTGAIITVSNVSVSPASATVYKGISQRFTAEVTGTNNPAQTVTWTVEGGGTETRIDNGLLTVALNESATTLTVKATSTVDSSKAGTATVTLQTPPLTGAVIINGTARQGYSLTSNTDNLHGSGTISYQWKRADTEEAAGGDISGATSPSYELKSDDVNKYISVTVSRVGYANGITSNVLGPVEEASVSTGSVGGTVTVKNGVEDVIVSFSNTGNLTLSRTGTLTVTVNGSYQAYRWYVDGVALNDESLRSLVLKGADYSTGSHRILVIVYTNEIPYSQEIRFTVN